MQRTSNQHAMKINALAFLPFLFLIWGCSQLDHLPEPARGDIIGYVALKDETDRELTTSFSGVRVVLEGANREVMTDEHGKWVFKDILAGTYELTFSKDGYADFKLFSVSHVGGIKPTVPFDGRLDIMQKTTAKITDLKSSFVKSDVHVTATFASDGAGRMYVGRSGNNSPTSYLFYTFIYATNNSVDIPISQLKTYGLKSGEEVSIKVYGSVSNFYSYFDPHYGTIINANLSDDFKEVKFKMP
jgi:hypothetical protein